MIKNLKNTPITAFFSVTIFLTFILYAFNIFKKIPCEKDMVSIFCTNFIHTDFYHIFSNLISFYALSTIEYKMGPKKFFILILYLLIFNTIFEFILHKIIKTPCSIGFSGVLYGIATFEIVCNKNLDYAMISALIINVAVSYNFDSKSSLSGHVIGIISGIIGGIILNNITKYCK